MRRGSSLALVLALVACGAGARPPAASATAAPASPVNVDVPFRDAGATQQSRHSGGPAIEAVAVAGGVRITAYQGEQRSGGYAITIERISRLGDELRVQARFTTPPPDSFNTMVITSPAHSVTVDRAAPVIILLDASGTEQARTRQR